jgi:hypothetical protein
MGILAKRRKVIDSIVVAVSNEGQAQTARGARGGTLAEFASDPSGRAKAGDRILSFGR